jgi:hypothetical protein
VKYRPVVISALLACVLSSCSGGGGGSSLPSVSAVTPNPALSATPAVGVSPTPVASTLPGVSPSPTATAAGSVVASPAAVTLGSPSTFIQESIGIPTSGGTSVFADGDTSTGGQGSPVDGINCNPDMSPVYHIHAHISIINGNSQVYTPQAIGLFQPLPATGTFPNSLAEVGTCAYDLHMHDHSGIIHIEAAAVPSTPYTLGQFFAIWGQPLSTTQVATLTGAVRIYVTPTAADGSGIQQPTLAPQLWAGPYTSIPLVAHQEITIVVGNSTLPLPRYTWPSWL